MAQPKRKAERGCEECGARIDSDGFCTHGCDDQYEINRFTRAWESNYDG